MNTSLRHLLTHQRVLLLQGKMGTFFCRFSKFLLSHKLQVHKMNFNAGDAFFYCFKERATPYRGKLDDYDPFLCEFIQKHQIDAVVCFNDCRPHHAIAKTVCKRLGVSFFVFEEGYLRPDYITLEEHGINGYSQLDPQLIGTKDKAHDRPQYTNNRFWRLCLASIIYYAAVFLGQWHYPHYRHYRNLGLIQEIFAWVLAPIRKLIGWLPDKYLQKKIIQTSTPYFVVALQVHNDSQISHHSDYADVHDFIHEVIASFAKHADSKALLVFKHHPLDRGHRNYRQFIKKLSRQYHLKGRVYYGCDLHLPSILKHCQGFVTINSTTALQAIYHKKPTKITGRALYNIPHLADLQPLDDFWQNPQAPDNDFYLKFRQYLIEQTQLNGAFYGKAPWELSNYPKSTDTPSP